MREAQPAESSPITAALAEFIVETGIGHLPAAVVDASKALWLDSLGVTIAGAVEPVGRAIAEHVREQGGSGQSVLIGQGLRSSPALAALANGTMAHALDYDDISLTWLGHPSAVLLPAVLALGTQLRASGAQTIAAYVVGWEVGAAVGRSIRHQIHESGWHSTSVTGTVAAAAACANLAGLDVAQTRTALGIAASLAAGMYANRGTDTKPLHAGNAARGGLLATDLALKGLDASPNLFDGPGNFCQTLIGEDCDEGKMLTELGKGWDIVRPGATVKLHACCGASHYCLDALFGLLNDHSLVAAEVAEIECHVPPGMPEVLIHSRPTTGLEAKFSLEYALAAALLDGRAGIAQFTDEAVLRPEAQELLRRVHYFHPAGMENSTREIVAQPHRVVVRLHSGERREAECRFFRGRPENPLSREELVGKFHDCAGRILDHSRRKKVLDLVDRLDALEDLADLNAVLT